MTGMALDTNLGFDIGLGLEETHVIVTGGAGQIGLAVVKAFLSAGSFVSALDLTQPRVEIQHDKLQWIQADIIDEKSLEKAFMTATSKYGMVSVCCAVAGLDLSFIPHHASICDMPLDQWQRTISVNVTGTFLTARCWLRGVREYANDLTKNASFIVIGSEAGVFGVPGNADYATSKAAIQYGLVRSLAPEASRIFGRARVNAIAPGSVNTPQFQKECLQDLSTEYIESKATVALARSVPVESVARSCLMLASENFSSSTTGQIINIDSGKSGRIFWKNDDQPTW